MKKKGNMIYVGFFFVLCLIPSVGMLLPQTQGSATENRKLAVWPQLRTEEGWCIHSRRRDPGQERLAVL